MIKKAKNARILVRNGKTGLDVYLDISGSHHYLYTRKPSGLLYTWLKNGISICELSRVKPKSSRTSQKRVHYAKRLLIIADEYITHELAC